MLKENKKWQTFYTFARCEKKSSTKPIDIENKLNAHYSHIAKQTSTTIDNP